jgi:hypothetical protein
VRKSNAAGILCIFKIIDATTQEILYSIIILHRPFRLSADWATTKPDDPFFGVCGLEHPNPGSETSLVRVPNTVFESAGNDVRVLTLETLCKHQNNLELATPTVEDGKEFVFESFKPTKGSVIPPSLILPISTHMMGAQD